MNTKMHYNITVSGRVQGVGFRWSAAAEARKFGITGFVRNLPNGNVYIEAEGSPSQLDDFVAWCKIGPAFGFVESVDTESLPPVNYGEFLIRH
jgi:acylphosphatase